VEQETGCIDWDRVAQKAKEVQPKLIICGASAYPRDWDYARLRRIADEVGALLMADISHPPITATEFEAVMVSKKKNTF
jgi:glycine hydroxymethyltransferase